VTKDYDNKISWSVLPFSLLDVVKHILAVANLSENELEPIISAKSA